MKKPPFVFFVALALILPVATPARAEDGGLPQLDPSLFPEQLFWLAISFATLYVLMRFVALPGVERAQGKRKNVMDTELVVAKAANEQARAMAHESDRTLAEARAKAQAAISDIKAESAKAAAEQQAEQNRKLGQKLRESEGVIAKAKLAAIKDMEASVPDLAAVIVDHVSGMKVKV